MDRPDIAIEVVWTSGGIDKLEVYRGLRVPEVWFLRDGVLRLFVLEGERYQQAERSRILPSFDPEPVLPYLAEPNQTRAVRAFRAALRGE